MVAPVCDINLNALLRTQTKPGATRLLAGQCVRYAFYIIKSDPPEPLTWLSGGDVTDCCYVLRKCGVADYERFSCRDLNDKRLFRGSATALYGGGASLTECSDVEAFLAAV